MSISSQARLENLGLSSVTLSQYKPHNETVVNLAPLLNAVGALAQIDQLLGPQAIRSSAFMAQSRFYWQLPYYSQEPSRHRSWDMLIRLYCDFRMGGQWYFGEAKGEISYYVVPYLDSAGRLGAYVDAWSYNQGGGGPFCAGEIGDALKSSVPKGIEFLQGLLDGACADVANVSFSSVYLLPGNGARRQDNAAANIDVDAAIAAIP